MIMFYGHENRPFISAKVIEIDGKPFNRSIGMHNQFCHMLWKIQELFCRSVQGDNILILGCGKGSGLHMINHFFVFPTLLYQLCLFCGDGDGKA